MWQTSMGCTWGVMRWGECHHWRIFFLSVFFCPGEATPPFSSYQIRPGEANRGDGRCKMVERSRRVHAGNL